MDDVRYRRVFFEVDTPIAENLASTLSTLAADSPSELRRTAGQLCHRLCGDSRTVGFDLLGELARAIEERLRGDSAGASSLDQQSILWLRDAAAELKRRMLQGEAACLEPLPEALERWLRSKR